MFRIKTDIRKYKCDSPEKVEKLIKSWVVRPSDLIYDAEGDADWSPIGEHPTFEPMFAALEEEEEVTVITNGVQEDDEDEAEEEEAPEAPEAPEGVEPSVLPEEITMMTERTASLLGIEDEAQQNEADHPPVEEADDEDTNEIDPEPAPMSRSDLPEELFLTNELAGPIVIGDLESDRLDELGQALDEPSDVDDNWASLGEGIRDTGDFEDTNEIAPRARSDEDEEDEDTSVVESSEAEDEDEGEDALDDAERSTLELDIEDIIAYDAQREAERAVSLADEGSDASESADEDDESQKSYDDFVYEETQELQAPGEDDTEGVVDDPLQEEDDEEYRDDTLDLEVEEVDMSSLVDELDDVEEVDVEDFDEATPMAREVFQDPNFVSEGYDLPLPFPIGPTDDDLAAGVRYATASTERKEVNFPYPRPKRAGVVYMRSFDDGKDATVSARDREGKEVTTAEFTPGDIPELGKSTPSSHPTATRRMQAVVGPAPNPSAAGHGSQTSQPARPIPDRTLFVLIAMFVVFIALVATLVVLVQ